MNEILPGEARPEQVGHDYHRNHPSQNGFTAAEAARRLAECGYNELPENGG
jgi:hypothetical protein